MVSWPEPARLESGPNWGGKPEDLVLLRAPHQGDYPILVGWMNHPHNIISWRNRARPVAPEQATTYIWNDVLTQVMVCDPETAIPLANASIFGADHRAGTAQIGLLVNPAHKREGRVIDGTTRFLDYVFRSWPMRRLYLHMLEFNFARLQGAVPRWFDLEACLSDHDYHDGRYWNYYIATMTRDRFFAQYESYDKPPFTLPHGEMLGRDAFFGLVDGRDDQQRDLFDNYELLRLTGVEPKGKTLDELYSVHCMRQGVPDLG